jgi:nitrogen fixation/metabolism regulation signal transduction histidine kinase
MSKMKKILSRLAVVVIIGLVLAAAVVCFLPAALVYIVSGVDLTERLDTWLQKARANL